MNFIRKIQDTPKVKWWYHQKGTNLIEKLLLLTVNISDHLPQSFKKIFIKIIDIIGLLVFRIHSIIDSFFSNYFIIEGIEKQSGEKITVLYKGNPESIIFFTKIFFKNGGKRYPIEKKVGREIYKGKKEYHQRNPDIVINQTDYFFNDYYQKKGRIIIPEYVSFIFNQSLESNYENFKIDNDISRDIKKAIQTNYTYEIKNGRDIFDLFYFHMYLPYINWKHKGEERIASYATIRHLEARGAKLLCIKHGNEYVFGGIFLKYGNYIKTYYAGLMERKFDHLYNGIMALSYHFFIKIDKLAIIFFSNFDKEIIASLSILVHLDHF
jgi:hypothetical protein